MKTILIPTDFSNNAYEALFYSAKLYSEHTTNFILLYSYEDEVSHLTSRVDIGKSEKVVDEIITRVEKQGAELIDKVRNNLGNAAHTFRFIATGMSVYRAVKKLITQENVSLMVMGTKGKTADENILVGSTTLQMIKKLKTCPLLVVPEKVNFVAPFKIGFATDFTEYSNLAHAAPLTELINSFHSSLEVIHVGEQNTLTEAQQTHLALLKKNTESFNTHFHFLKKEQSISKTIQKFVEKEDIDLLVLVYRKHNMIMKLFREPVINKLSGADRTLKLIIPQE